MEMDEQLESMIHNKTLEIIREENAVLLSTIILGARNGLQQYLQIRKDDVDFTQEQEEEKDGDISIIDYEQTKGIRKKTIQTAELVADILREKQVLRLRDLRDEVEKRGGSLGANPTLYMKSILKISPVIKKIGHGRFKYNA